MNNMESFQKCHKMNNVIVFSIHIYNSHYTELEEKRMPGLLLHKFLSKNYGLLYSWAGAGIGAASKFSQHHGVIAGAA
jgi:hypothetical protein